MEALTDGLNLALDGLLALTLLWVGWRVLTSKNLFKGIVLFIAFGLIMALIWVRLAAPDVALAEAAIGAGLTGALLLAAWSRLARSEVSDGFDDTAATATQPRSAAVNIATKAVLFGVSTIVFCGLAAAVLSLPPSPGLGDRVAENLVESGVENPVTAVLLNFRAYDTLLEMGVLFLAVVAAWSLTPARTRITSDPGNIFGAFVQLLVPLMVLVSAYLLWIGARAPGGAFQAGAVLAAALILTLLTGRNIGAAWLGWPLRLMLSFGLSVFIAIGFAVMAIDDRFLEYPAGTAGQVILLIEVAATLSIGITLAALFHGGRPEGRARP